jgi:enamine deaminase RidA (YjgF/YER057c/UK114 family)
MSTIERWPGSAPGRSRTVALGNVVWTVANAIDPSVGFEEQVRQSLALLDSHLSEAGSARTHLLSVQVLLANLEDRPAFDALWQAWIGPEPAHWPQRACYQAGLAPGLQVELIAVAASHDTRLTVGVSSVHERKE